MIPSFIACWLTGVYDSEHDVPNWLVGTLAAVLVLAGLVLFLTICKIIVG